MNEILFPILPYDVVGVDVGKANLGVCRLKLLGFNGRKIRVHIDFWAVRECRAGTQFAQVFSDLIGSLDERQHVVVEQQSRNSTNLVAMADAILATFSAVSSLRQGHSYTCKLVSAANKLKPFEGQGFEFDAHIGNAERDGYRARKDSAEKILTFLLEEMLDDAQAHGDELRLAELEQFIQWYASLRKRDDAADSFLHAFSYMHRVSAKMLARVHGAGALPSASQLAAALGDVKGSRTELDAMLAPEESLRLRVDTLRAKIRESNGARVANGRKRRANKTVAELKDEARALGVKLSGTRAELLERLNTQHPEDLRTMHELKAQCRFYGLKVSGKREDLLARLAEAEKAE